MNIIGFVLQRDRLDAVCLMYKQQTFDTVMRLNVHCPAGFYEAPA